MLDTTVLYERLMRGALMLSGGRSREVSYGDGMVHVLDLPGSGPLPPLVLLHGFSASGPSQYGSMLRHLRPYFQRILMPDLPGHGSSSIPRELSGEIMSRGLHAALDALIHPGRPVVLFASSMSGGLAVRYAFLHPRRVLGLMLCSPGGAPPTSEELAALRDAFDVDSHEKALAFVDRMLSEPHWLRQGYAWGVRQQFRRPHLRSLLDRAANERFLTPDEVRGLQIPIHLIWGEADQILPQRHLAFFREHLPPHALVETPAHFGHAPFLHRSDELAVRVIRFARRLANRTRRQAFSPAA
jgi:pimeloyl-ACP methyl ester carboxylesterase